MTFCCNGYEHLVRGGAYKLASERNFCAINSASVETPCILQPSALNSFKRDRSRSLL